VSSASESLTPTPNYGIVVAPSSYEARLRIDLLLGVSLNSLDDHLLITVQRGCAKLTQLFKIVAQCASYLLRLYSRISSAVFFGFTFIIPPCKGREGEVHASPISSAG
jgi:hypothetical protein